MEPLDDATRQLMIEELDHAKHGYGLANDFTGEARDVTPTCGDEVTVRVTVDGDTLASLSWEGHGCAVSQASASALGGLGAMPVAEFRELATRFLASVAPDGVPVDGDTEPFATIGRFPLRARCASLAWKAAIAAID